MGSGRVVRNDQEGFIIDPFDIDGWVKAIRSVAKDSVLRRRFGASASSRAKEYTWKRASARLYGHLIDCIIAGRTNAGKQPGADNRSPASTVPPVRQ